MKTGTSFLQDVMIANQRSLAEAGYLFPGETWPDQSRAVRDILFDPSPDPRMRAQLHGMWAKLRDQMLAHQGRASIISMEFLSFADEERARRIVDSLGGADVHAVLTVRDAAAAIPAQWQTTCRNGGKLPYERMLTGVRLALDEAGDHQHRPPYRLFQRTQGIPRMLDAWVPVVGPERMHVVTVPPRGSDPVLLWHRFAQVVGVDPTGASLEKVLTNPSLGLASTELVRLLNVELGKVNPMDYRGVVKGPLARLILAGRAHLEAPVRLDRRGAALAARWNGVVLDAVAAHGVSLVGSPDDLPTAPPGPETPDSLAAPTEGELLSAAATARAGLIALRDDLGTDDRDPIASRRALVRLSRRIADLPVPHAWTDSAHPLRTAVTEVARLARDCMALHGRSPGGLRAPDGLDDPHAEPVGGHDD
jgi:hypothetical protein